MRFILALALGLRLAVVSIVLFSYPRDWLFSKAPDLGFLACSLSSGHGLSSPFGGSTGPTAFLAPGYPGVVGLVFYFFGSYSLASAALIMGLQTMFGVLTVAAIMRVAGQLFGRATARLAGAFWAVSPPLLWLPAVLWDTSLSALLLIGMVALALRCVDRPGKGLWAVMGGYCGAGDVGESVAHARVVCRGRVECMANTRTTVDLWACLAGRVRSMASAECTCAARVYPSAQQLRI